jgi:hypothetical protein
MSGMPLSQFAVPHPRHVDDHIGEPHIEKLVGRVFEQKKTQSLVTQGDIDKIVEEETRRLDAETLGSVLSGLEKHMREHLKSHEDGSECEFVTEIKKLYAAVEKRLQAQLS